MSEIDDQAETPPPVQRRSIVWHLSRGTAMSLGGLLALVVLAIGGFWWYTTTADFQRRVGREIVAVLENATGGRVELSGVKFSLWHLAIEVDGLVIHGLEGPGEAPYLSVDKVEVRVKITSFLAHTAGSGLGSHVGLNLLRVEHPQVHLIVDKDGKTNQPVPRHPEVDNEPLQDKLLDLRANEVELVHGVALLNDRAVPFDMAARDLDAEVSYLSATDRYGIAIDLSDLRTKMRTEPEAQSRLRVAAELGRDVAELKSLEFDSGKASVLHATGTLKHFAQPEWNAAVKGTVELKQLSVLADVKVLTAGTMELEANGHSCALTPVAAEAHTHFWQLHRSEKPGPGLVASGPECRSGYLVVGGAKLHDAGYEDQNVLFHDVNGGTQMHITPSEMLFTQMLGTLPGGGSATGELHIVNWQDETPTTVEAPGKRTPMPEIAAHVYLTAKVNAIPLRTIMDVTQPRGYGDWGFDTAVTGPVKAEWGGVPMAEVPATVTVDGQLQFRPTGVVRRGALNNVPMTGEAVAHYDGKRQVVNIQHVILLTPGSTTEASGVLGVNGGDPLTNLRADMTVRDLGEFDQLLHTLDLEANGRKGTAAIPVVLHGGLVFHGTVSGRAADLDAKGHLQGSQMEVKLGTELDTQIDSLVADAEYSNDGGLAVASSTIKRGDALLSVEGSMRPRKAVSRAGAVAYEWDEGTVVEASLKLADAQVADVLQIAGQQQKIPATGTMTASAHVSGTLGDLNGQGAVSLMKGVAYGEPYDSATANLAVTGEDFEASRVAVQLHGARIAGNVGYDAASKHVHGHIEGDNLVLSKFQTFAKASPNADGTLTFAADANGTMEEPGLKATAKLAGVSVDGRMLGGLSADMHSEGSTLQYTAASTLVGAKVDGSGQTQLTGDYETQARLAFSGFDIGTAIEMFSPGTVKAQSAIGGTVTVSGPLNKPAELSGAAELSDFDVKLEGVELKSEGPLRVGLKNGLATLDQVHITGQDTDLIVSGAVQAFGATGANGGKLDVKANGSVSMAIAHTFDPDIISSGKVEFAIAAGGTVGKPSLTGKVQFDNVNAAVEGIPNGLSALNGTLVFNEDRLEVANLVATTGGGQMKVGGFLTYRNGLYADLTATGDVVRVRLYGLSATGNASLRLQGSPQSLLLSGNVLITRFGVGRDVDFAAFSAAGGLSAPPEPGAASNKIAMNVHVTSSPQLDFQNSYAKLAGTVDLTVRGTVAEPTMLGRIQITEGSATFAGTKYELQRGDIYFSNPVRIDPTIDLNATARVETYDVTVGLQGTMSNLKPTYRSEPPLSEADIFALLALGRTQEEAQVYQEQEVQQGANPTTDALLGGALNATVSNRIGKLFGGGSVKIDPAFVGTLGNSSARITVQQQISRQLTVTYATNVNYTAQELLQAQYDLTPNMSIVVARDESGVFSVVYKIRRRYK